MASEEKASGDAYINDKPEQDNVSDKGKEVDETKVKFINGGNQGGADAVVVVDPPSKPVEGEFAGMTKEELAQYADDPFWVRTRLIFFIGFWVAWIAMLAAAIIIIVVAPKCPPKPDLDWWQTGVMYQVSPQSFKDTDGNGIGDLNGMISELDYLKDLGVKSLVLAPIFQSAPNTEIGYAASDFTAVHSDLGTMDDFRKLVRMAHKKRLKIILDIVPYSTSKSHSWFNESMKANDDQNQFKNYYIWADSKGSEKNKFGNSAWSSSGSKFYMNTCGDDAPDLNLANPAVVKELKGVLSFWMDKGVDGFRFQHVSHSARYGSGNVDPSVRGNVTRQLKEELDNWISKLDTTRVLLVEDDTFESTVNDTMKLYDDAEAVVNRELLGVGKDNCMGKCISDIITKWLGANPDKWSTWMTGDYETSRVANRVGDAYVPAMTTLLLTLPGTAISYYGEEIGMKDTVIEPTNELASKIQNGVKRLASRSPMQWTSGLSAGFTNGTKPYLPIPADFVDYNVKSEQATGAVHQYLKVYKDLVELREEPSMSWGTYLPSVVNDNILSYVRRAEGHPSYLVAINFGKSASTDDYNGAVTNLVPEKAEVVFNNGIDRTDAFEVGSEADMTNLLLKPGEAVIFKFPFM